MKYGEDKMENSKWCFPDTSFIFSRDGIWLAKKRAAQEANKGRQYCGQIGHIPVYNLLIYGRMIELERLLRKLVLYLAKAEQGLNWRASIPKEAEARLEEEKSYRNIVESTSQNPISFMEISELERLLVSESIWSKHLKGSFPKLEETKGTFRRLKAIRNKVAHVRPCSNRDNSLFYECARVITDSVTAFARGENWARVSSDAEINEWDDATHFDDLFQTSVQGNASHYRVEFKTIPRLFNIVTLIDRLCSLENYFTFFEIDPFALNMIAITFSRRIPPRRSNWFLRTLATHINSSGVSKEGEIVMIPIEPVLPETMPEFCVPFSDSRFDSFDWLVWL
jgi:hypothetical protein